MGTVGDSFDNALAETVIGLYKTEVIRNRGPWRDIEGVEFATLDWVDWLNKAKNSWIDRLRIAARTRGGVLSSGDAQIRPMRDT